MAGRTRLSSEPRVVNRPFSDMFGHFFRSKRFFPRTLCRWCKMLPLHPQLIGVDLISSPLHSPLQVAPFVPLIYPLHMIFFPQPPLHAVDLESPREWVCLLTTAWCGQRFGEISLRTRNFWTAQFPGDRLSLPARWPTPTVPLYGSSLLIPVTQS